jgi:hypothetical protein
MMNIGTINIDSKVWRMSDVVFSRLDDEMLAIDSEAGYCYSLNESAAMIWELIREPRTVAELCSSLQAEYVIDENKCQEEVLHLLNRLSDAGLIQAG